MRKYKRLLSVLFLSLLLAGLIVAPTLAQDDTTPPGSAEPTPVVEPPPGEAPAVEQPAVPEAAPQAIVGWTGIYNLFATDGYVSLADGTVLYIYGFIGGDGGRAVVYQNSVVAPPGSPKNFPLGGLIDLTNNPPGTGTTWPTPSGGVRTGLEVQLAGNAQFPGPVIYAGVGDPVQINLKNLGVTNPKAPNDPHSIHLHGLDVNAANDGVPETSVGAVPANLVGVPGAGNVIVYMFNPTKPGTYMYHCHQEADIHVQMGMYGALVVYDQLDPACVPAPGAPCAMSSGARNGPGGSGALWGWNYDKDYILLLTEVDVRQHVSEQKAFAGGAAFNPVNYQPQYWLINGLGFPNTIHASAGVAAPFNWDTWIKAHPGYDPFIVGSVAAPGQKVLLRVINLGFETQPMHMHGFHGKILGSDQREWPWAQPAGRNVFNGTGMEKNTLTVGSGETYEWLLDFGTWTTAGAAGTYPATGGVLNLGTQSKFDPVTLAPTTNNTLPANCPAANPNCAIPDPFAPVVGQTYIGGPRVGPAGPAQGVTPGDAASVAAALVGAGSVPPVPAATIAGQLFPFHNHDDYKATNNGVYPGGMFTMIMTTP